MVKVSYRLVKCLQLCFPNFGLRMELARLRKIGADVGKFSCGKRESVVQEDPG